jgi:hypothetical protein
MGHPSFQEHILTHTHPSHSQTSRLLTSSLSLGVPVLQLRVDDSVFLIDKKDREDVVPLISGDGMS